MTETPAMPLYLPLYPEQPTPYPLYHLYELPEAERGRHAAPPSLMGAIRAALRPSRRPAHLEGYR